MEKSTPLWCEDCRFICFETGLGKPMLTLNDPNGLKNTTNVYSIHLELRMALPCQISIGKWKYVNPCRDFLGIPDQRTVYVKRQARPRWTYVRRSSVTPDLVKQGLMMTSSNRSMFRVTGHLCGNSSVTGEFPAQGPVTRSFDVFFDLRLNKGLSKQSWGWWFETPSCPL